MLTLSPYLVSGYPLVSCHKILHQNWPNYMFDHSMAQNYKIVRFVCDLKKKTGNSTSPKFALETNSWDKIGGFMNILLFMVEFCQKIHFL